MIPTLIIDNEEHKVATLDYGNDALTYASIERNGQLELHWNDSVCTWDETAIDLDKSIHWEGRYAPLYSAIEELIVKYRGELTELSKEIMNSLIGTEYVPPNLITKYRELQYKLDGVYTTLELVKEVDNFRNKERVEADVL